MSETALVMQISAEWDTFYAILQPVRGDVQKWSEVARLVATMKKSFPEMHEITGWDSSVNICEAGVWKEERPDALDGGDWVEVPLTMLDLSGTHEARTECDEIHIDEHGVHWSFYPKHSDTRLSTSPLNIADILTFINERR